MADKEHLEVLSRGVEVWNRWRKWSREAPLYSLGLDVHEEGLSDDEINFEGTFRPDRFPDLRAADLRKEDLSRADLSGVDLTGANLSETNLSEADLTIASLSGANLFRANLSETNLSRANLERAMIGWTIFGSTDLSHVAGLETVEHVGPSTIGIDTIYRSQGQIPEIFLRKAGVPEIFTTYLGSLIGQPIQFYSCFLSHASADSPFADRLRSDLLANNVSCWHYRYDMRGGQFWRAQINEAIKVHDKLVLICSKASLQRRNVVDEIVAAMERERETGSQKLFPIRLDNFILSDEMLKLVDEQLASGHWREDWVRYVRAYHIPDFSRWKRDHDAYQAEFTKFLEVLKSPAKR